MPIEYYENNKTVIIAGDGDIVWGPGSQEEDDKPEYIVVYTDGVVRGVNVELPELKGKVIDDWAVKIVLPTKAAWKSLRNVVNSYAKGKWGEIPK